uniref:Uncharacterized protein n=1 Tax=Arion vulgaris TaxID=1028688 RepID=A0A0B7B6N0_9EUPU
MRHLYMYIYISLLVYSSATPPGNGFDYPAKLRRAKLEGSLPSTVHKAAGRKGGRLTMSTTAAKAGAETAWYRAQGTPKIIMVKWPEPNESNGKLLIVCCQELDAKH